MWKYFVLSLLMFSAARCNDGIPKNMQEFLSALERLLEVTPEEPKLLPKYDFIIVGAGSAGCVVANRLSENPKWKILLIEAGNNENRLMDIPLTVGYLQLSSANWNYTTERNGNYCRGLVNGICHWPRGRVMGGSSSLNYMIYTRGNAKDFDEWEHLGNQGWAYKDLLPYFKEIENITIDKLKDSEYHNTRGYMDVGYAPFKNPIADVAIKANEEFGMDYVDYNGAHQIGVSRIQTNMKDGFRDSANGAYILPFNRTNLDVIKMAMVKKVLFNKRKEACGVEFVHNGKTSVVSASKEVIISAGAINSPHLLMLSGIGPKSNLKKFNIDVLTDLPVGKNLMDHIAVPLIYTTDDSITMPAYPMPDIQDYLQHGGNNSLSTPGGVEVISFHALNSTDRNAAPDIELLYTSGSFAGRMASYKYFNIKESIYQEIYKPLENNYSFMSLPLLLSPKSRGHIQLASADYRVHPEINPNYFDHPDDMKTMVAGLKLAMNIAEQPAFKKIHTTLDSIPMTDCPYKFNSDEYLECICRTLTLSFYHYSGTCKMGPKHDSTSVVDERLRVHGIKRLRVIDASIMPKVTRGHTNSPSMMIGEKGADLIKQDWQRLPFK